MTEIKTIYGIYTYFNEIPVHSVFIWGKNLKFIKLADAIPDAGVNEQPCNCRNLHTNNYSTMTAKCKVKLIEKKGDYSWE